MFNHCFPLRRAFFLLFVESPPSTFMHHLREHSCHSEYIMCIVPKFSLIDSHCWFHLFLNYLYLVALLNLKVSYAFMFCSLMKDKLKTIWLRGFHCFIFIVSFSYDLNTHLTFIVSFSWSFICVLFHVITWLLSFFYQDYIFHAHVLSSFDPSAQRLHIWSRLCRCMSPKKLFLLLSLTYSRTSRS
jgi:hypothetical protein